MHRRLPRAAVAVVAAAILVACTSPLHFTVLFDQVFGLLPRDPVVWQTNPIGRVTDVQYTPAGRFEVKVEVDDAYRAAVTDRSRFVIEARPDGEGKLLEMLRVGEGGEPISTGAVLQGTTQAQVLAETFQDQAQSLLENLRQLPKDWSRVLGEEMDRLTEELRQAGEEARRRLHEEVVPRLQRQLEELRKWLRQQGREDEMKPLERKFEKLKEV